MTRKEVVQNNVLIATFMGAKGDIIFTSTRISKFPNGKQYKDISLKYDKKWEWLMEVVEKIEKIYDEFHGYFFFFWGGVHITSNSCTIQGSKLNPGVHDAYYGSQTLSNKFDSTYGAILDFINWYNKN